MEVSPKPGPATQNHSLASEPRPMKKSRTSIHRHAIEAGCGFGKVTRAIVLGFASLPQLFRESVVMRPLARVVVEKVVRSHRLQQLNVAASIVLGKLTTVRRGRFLFDPSTLIMWGSSRHPRLAMRLSKNFHSEIQRGFRHSAESGDSEE